MNTQPRLGDMIAVGRWVGLLLALAMISSGSDAGAEPEVSAGPNSVAVGRDLINSPVNIGVPPEVLEALVRDRTKGLQELAEMQKDALGLLKEKLQLNERQIRAALTAAGEADVPPERLGEKLLDIAERYKALQAEVRPAPGDDPRVAELKAQAAKAIEQGELEQADKVLANLAQAQEASLERAALEVAATHARRGDVALARLRYRDAADHFAAAASRVPPSYPEQRFTYLNKEADALYRQGEEFGDNQALLAAIERYSALVALYPRERVPLDWAATQTNLGIALVRLGERESGTARLEEAVTAFRAALQEFTRERGPLQWATTQNNLGNTLAILGAQESDRARLEEAVAAYRAALLEYTRERGPLQWAMTQTNLGTALWRLGERESGTARLEGGGAGPPRRPAGTNPRARAARLGDNPDQSRQCPRVNA